MISADEKSAFFKQGLGRCIFCTALYMLGIFALLSYADLFLSKSALKSFMNAIGPGLVHTICIDYQQTTKVAASKCLNETNT